MWISRRRLETLEKRVEELSKQSCIKNYAGSLHSSDIWETYVSERVPLAKVVALMANHLGIQVEPSKPERMVFPQKKAKS